LKPCDCLVTQDVRTVRKASKARENLAQAESLIRVLAEDRPYDLEAA